MLSKTTPQQSPQAAAGARTSSTDRDAPGAKDTRLSGRALVLARTTWIAVTVAAIWLFIAALPARWQYLHTFCSSALCTRAQLTAHEVHALPSIGLTLDGYALYFMVLPAVFSAVFVAVATLLIWHRSAERIALFGAFALVLLGVIVLPDSSVPFHLTREHPAWQAPLDGLTLLATGCALLFFYSFPDGRFVPRWTGALVVVWAAIVVPTGLFPDAPDGVGRLPLAVRDLLQLGVLAPIPFVQVYRYRRTSDAARRQQSKWVVFGLASSVVLFLGLVVSGILLSPSERNNSVLNTMIVQSMFYLIMLPIPLSIGVAVLRYHLWDIDLVINRTVVYGALTASVIGIYVLIVGGIGALLQTQGNPVLSLLAAALVAVLFQPLRTRLQRGVNHLMYGERDEPYAVVARLGQRLENTLAPDDVLPTIVGTVTEALKLPYAAIALRQGEELTLVASSGTATNGCLHLPLVYQNDMIGELFLAPRAPGESFTPADERLLRDLARHAGIAAHAVQLTADLQQVNADLQRSRARLVTGREEERRRLRRDLHDGLGAALTGLTFGLDTASNLLSRDPEAVRDLLHDLKTQARAAIANIRQLVYDLRPPVLDELGLAGALREQVSHYQLDGTQVALDIPDVLPPLPAAVEVAAYRIVLEALANVVRHAQAHTCSIRLDMSGDVLRVEVRDDGVGLPPDYRAGVGMTAMRERAAELGGSVTVGSMPTGGTRVQAQLPLVMD